MAKSLSLRFTLCVFTVFLCILTWYEYFKELSESGRSRKAHGRLEMTTSSLPSDQRRHLPHAIVIGVRKGGTRAFLKFFRLHSDVAFMSTETHFFDMHFSRGLEYYRNEMPVSLDRQITMEKTPDYFTDPYVPRRIYDTNSSIRLILIVREPVSRLFSDYADRKEKGMRDNSAYANRTFESFVFDEDGYVDLRYIPAFVSTYYIHLARWLEWFNLDQMHIVDGDNFIKNPSEELYKVESFLGLQHQLTPDVFQFNKAKGFFCVRSFRKGAAKHKCLGNSKGREYPQLNPRTAEKLKKYYEYSIERFCRMANQTFKWCIYS